MDTLAPPNPEAMGPPTDQPSMPELQPAFDDMAETIAEFEEQFAGPTQAEINAQFAEIVAGIQDEAVTAVDNGEELVSATAEISVTETITADGVSADVDSDIVDIETRPVETEQEITDVDAGFAEIVEPIEEEMLEAEIVAEAEQVVTEAAKELEAVFDVSDEAVEIIEYTAAKIETADDEITNEQTRNEFKLHLVQMATARTEMTQEETEEPTEISDEAAEAMVVIEATWQASSEYSAWQQVDAVATATEVIVSEMIEDDEQLEVNAIVEFSAAVIAQIAQRADLQQEIEPIITTDSIVSQVDAEPIAA